MHKVGFIMNNFQWPRLTLNLSLIAMCFLSGVGILLSAQIPNDWANKEGRDEMVLIYDGKTDEAIKLYQKRLVDDPNRQEALFGLAVAHAKNGEGEQAMTFVTRALGAGLPFERFTAGPREMLEPLHGLSAFKALKNEKSLFSYWCWSGYWWNSS